MTPPSPRPGVVGLLIVVLFVGALPQARGAGPADHWAFRAPRRPSLPATGESGWARGPIDRFILAGLESGGLRHSPEADRVALIRRATYDLTGLPPSPDEVDRFAADGAPDAFERLVDRLLDSPRYGERWAQHWLDLAHHADSNGFEQDAERPDAWRYRDWVVSALNGDMPYDRFVTLQLAGDEAEPGDPSALIATGFGRGGPREVVGGNVDPKVKRQSELTEVTSTVGSVFLGLTIGCARCHDHKFDPIPTTDYYSLQAFFAASELVEVPIGSPAEVAAHEAANQAAEARLVPLQGRLAEVEAPYRKAIRDRKEASLTAAERGVLAIPKERRRPTEQRMAEGAAASLAVKWEEVAEAVARDPGPLAEREKLRREVEAIRRSVPRPPPHAQALVDRSTEAPETFVLRRGQATSPGPRVEPRPPIVLLGERPEASFDAGSIRATASTTGRRLALARWLTRPDNTLAARVIVNRLWQGHFGRGLVATPSDFGVQGEGPSHPELLDWLATELVAGGWRLKPIHRLMVTSAAYRQTSAPPADLARAQSALDPENGLLWRMNRRRVDAEGVRDAMLAASGELNPKVGGPGVLVPIEKEVEDLIFTEDEVVTLWPVTPDPAEHLRRSLYLFRKRNVRYPLFDAFDAPDTQTACPRRMASTHALQALALLNGDFAADRARALAGRILRESAGDSEARVALAYRFALGRAPRPNEVARDRAFLAAQAGLLRRLAGAGQTLARPTTLPEGFDPAEGAAWVDFALAMLNRNEFVYVP